MWLCVGCVCVCVVVADVFTIQYNNDTYIAPKPKNLY